ncbi:MAG: MOSC domain-containing protein [Oceanospirillaceae bacterium]|nr:MOSC domain-containing protein [Oceanospirillaceae bacterium]
MSNVYVSSLSIYPLKSAAAIDSESIYVTTDGLQGDRQYMLVKLDGTFITGRTHPKITSIQCELINNNLVLHHPSCDALALDAADFSSQYHSTSVWGTKLLGQECSPEANKWVSDLLGEPLRLIYFGEKSTRKVVDHIEHTVGFADGFPLLLVNQTSLEHLNDRLLSPVTMLNFRPNITVSGSIAWAEDGWAKIKIGEVTFALTKPCSRCIFTTVDPATHTLDKGLEPLKTLTTYRKESAGSDVIFGENMLALNSGMIRLGDKVEILEIKQQPQYIDNWPSASRRLSQQLTLSNSRIVVAKQLLRCIAVYDETADVKTFVFCADPMIRFNYLPGQFITISLEIDKVTYQRCYTLSSSPSRPDTLALTIKRVEGGIVSNFLHEHFAVGSSLSCTAPSGKFHLQHDTRSKILLLSAGSGITPMLSILRFIADSALNIDLHFHHSAKSAADLIAFNEIELLLKRITISHLSINITRETRSDQSLIDTSIGRLSAPMLLKHCPDLLERDVLVCGPDTFMQHAKNGLVALGLPEEQYAQESFNVDVLEPLQNEGNTTYTVKFVNSDIEVEIGTSQTVLEAAEEAGVYVDYSCLAGICGTCNSQLLSGDVYAPNAQVLDEEDIKNGEFLPCCSYARSDLEIAL